jgi:hypothetical protein
MGAGTVQAVQIGAGVQVAGIAILLVAQVCFVLENCFFAHDFSSF